MIEDHCSGRRATCFHLTLWLTGHSDRNLLTSLHMELTRSCRETLSRLIILPDEPGRLVW